MRLRRRRAQTTSRSHTPGWPKCGPGKKIRSAVRHALIALEGQRPLELDTTVALLEILSGSLDQAIALDAATALVELRRELVERYPDSPTALRDLSVSLNKVAGIQQQRGQLDDEGFPGSGGS